MPRNFYRRVEVMFPIEAAELKDRILHEIVPAYLRDNVKARILQPDGTYVRSQPSAGEPPYRCQERLLAIRPSAIPEREPRPAFASSFGGNGDDADLPMLHDEHSPITDGNGAPQEEHRRVM